MLRGLNSKKMKKREKGCKIQSAAIVSKLRANQLRKNVDQ